VTPTTPPLDDDRDTSPGLDVAGSFARLGEMFVKHIGGEKVWKGGLGDVVTQACRENLPGRVTARDIGVAAGILQKPKKKSK
jgi:hypothetical protein